MAVAGAASAESRLGGSPMAERFERHTRTFALLSALSRVTGLGRDAAMSRVFGAGPLMDAFFFAFMIPNLFRRLFGEGAVAAAFLRVYAQLDKNDPATAARLATFTVGLLVAGLGAVTLAGELVLAWLSASTDEGLLVVRLTMIMLPYMPMICLAAILGAMLQVHGRFGPSAAVPIVLNLCLIGTTAGLAPLFGADDRGRHVTVVAASVIVAGDVQLVWMAWALRGDGRFRRDVKPAREPMRAVLGQAGPMILGLGVLQLNVFLDGVIASYPTIIGPTVLGVAYPLGEGALAAVSFAQRLYQFPLGVFGIAVATAIFPALARLADDGQAFADILRRGLRLVLFIGLPASAGLALVGPLLVRVILQGGEFGANDAGRVAFVLYGYAAGVWAYSMIHVFTRAFYAMGDARTPVTVAVVMVAVNLVLNCTLIWTGLREAGLAWSTALCAVVQSIVLLALMRRRVPDILGSAVAASGARTAVLTVAMTVAVAGALAVMPDAVTWSQTMVTLLVAVGIGLLVVAGGARLLRMPELRWALGRS